MIAYTDKGIPVIGFSAWSGTGKTTLVERIIRNLIDKGVRVGVLKHDAHGIQLDHEGKDSWRFTQAGAAISMVCGPEMTGYTEKRELTLQEALSLMHDVDLVLVEGYKTESLRRIGISRKAAGKGFTAPPETFIAVVTDENVPDCPVPVFGFDDIERITEFIMQNMKDFTHFNDEGKARMVNVGEKPETHRTASAAVSVLVSRETFQLIQTGGMKKGDVLAVAQVAGIMGAKRTADLIPMCHPIPIEGIDLKLKLDEEACAVQILSTVSCDGKTGVEMEALTAASIAALTVYDMCKAVQKDITITDLRLMEKSGGVHGDYRREESK